MSSQYKRGIEKGAIISYKRKVLEEYKQKMNKFKEYIEDGFGLYLQTARSNFSAP
jgi:hypothetical protein